ncbi:TPA: hypothetical protein N0F65_001275 [Lagenidium giganteum]|uniref:PDZ domain-containing protein n=1 Tax=Lagenidium giganteum TaxID=4803 RepID=A0AAV2YTP7_9STRA|nr:TPA: hypothetical protein N0F65_001275 [Lagenidium giganteum]
MGAVLCTCLGSKEELSLDALKMDSSKQKQQAVGSVEQQITAKKLLAPAAERSFATGSRTADTHELSCSVVDEQPASVQPVEENQDEEDEHQSATKMESMRLKLLERPLSARSKLVLFGAHAASAGFSDSESSGGEDMRFSDLTEEQRLRRSAQRSRPPTIEPEAEVSSEHLSEYFEEDGEDFEEEDEWKLHANPFRQVTVPPGPCGLLLKLDADPAIGPLVEGFVTLPDGSRGAIELSGVVHPGSVLCAINGTDVLGMPIREVLRTMSLSSHLTREFVFRDSNHDYDDL